MKHVTVAVIFLLAVCSMAVAQTVATFETGADGFFLNGSGAGLTAAARVADPTGKSAGVLKLSFDGSKATWGDVEADNIDANGAQILTYWVWLPSGTPDSLVIRVWGEDNRNWIWTEQSYIARFIPKQTWYPLNFYMAQYSIDVDHYRFSMAGNLIGKTGLEISTDAEHDGDRAWAGDIYVDDVTLVGSQPSTYASFESGQGNVTMLYGGLAGVSRIADPTGASSGVLEVSYNGVAGAFGVNGPLDASQQDQLVYWVWVPQGAPDTLGLRLFAEDTLHKAVYQWVYSAKNIPREVWYPLYLDMDEGRATPGSQFDHVANRIGPVGIELKKSGWTGKIYVDNAGLVGGRTGGQAAPTMQLSAYSLNVGASVGTVWTRVNNTGSGTLSWSTTDNTTWLASDNSRKDTISISFLPNTGSLPRTGTVTVSSNALNSPVTITVNQAAAQGSTGSLAVTVQDAEDWGLAGPNALVRLYAGAGQLVDSQRTNASSVATFGSIPAQGGYSYQVTFIPDSSNAQFGRIFWGGKSGINVAAGQTTQETFIRNMPYAPAIDIFRAGTSVSVANQTIPAGTPLRIELRVKNPSYAGAQPESIKVRVALDTTRSQPFEVDLFGSVTPLIVGQADTIALDFTPQSAGRYYYAGGIVTTVRGVETYTEGFCAFDQPFITVTGAAAPQWTTVNTGVSHTIIVPKSATISMQGTPLVDGDYVAVFYDAGGGTLACAGLERWTGTSDLAIVASGDNPGTAGKDGLANGEVFRWKLWRHADGRIFDASAVYQPVGAMGGVVTDGGTYRTKGVSWVSSLTGVLAGVDQKQETPKEFSIAQNYPNPFNPSTIIRYALPEGAAVRLVVYNALGQMVADLLEENQEAGYHDIRFNATGLASGIYFYRLQAGRFVQTRSMILLR